MSKRKTERQACLVLCLLNTSRHLTVQEIRDTVSGYDDSSEEAFRRMFERDKDELRELGVPIETGGENGDGYRIPRRDYELPAIDLEPDEAAAVGLASRLWEAAPLSGDTAAALLKLRAAGVVADDGEPLLQARIATGEPSFLPLYRATHDGQAVRFTYRSAGSAAPTERDVQPWAMVSRRGWWYLIGLDLGRGESRTFRLSRVVGDVTPYGGKGAVQRPPDFDLQEQLERISVPEAKELATVRLRRGRADGLRRAALSVVQGEDGWDTVELPYSSPGWLAPRIAQQGVDAVVTAPEEVRAAVVAHLQALVRVTA